MSAAVQLSRRDRMMLHCAPIREEHVDDRPLRTALHHARKMPAFAIQQNFDQAAQQFQRVLKLDANRVSALYNLGLLHFSQAEFAQAAGRIFEADTEAREFVQRGGHSLADHRFVTLHINFDK